MIQLSILPPIFTSLSTQPGVWEFYFFKLRTRLKVFFEGISCISKRMFVIFISCSVTDCKSIACLLQVNLHKPKIIIFHCEATKASELIKRGRFSIKLTVTTLVKFRMKMKRHEWNETPLSYLAQSTKQQPQSDSHNGSGLRSVRHCWKSSLMNNVGDLEREGE